MKMIVCVSENYGIGNNNKLLFSIPEDMKFFKNETMGKTIIMGRKTLDSFPGGKALKGRRNIVLSRDANFSRENTEVVHSRHEALKLIKDIPTDEVYIIGGCGIYDMFKDDCNEALVTKVYAEREADAFFFNIDSASDWKKVTESQPMTYCNIKFTFNRYIKD